MQKEIVVNGKTFVIRELLAIELDGINLEDRAKALREQVRLSTNITDEEYNKLSVKERGAIMKVINELNFQDFQEPAK
jgi:hypothetical protein